MCTPNGEAGIPAKCPRRGDCRGCPHFVFHDGEQENRRTAPAHRYGASASAPDPASKFSKATSAAGLPR